MIHSFGVPKGRAKLFSESLNCLLIISGYLKFMDHKSKKMAFPSQRNQHGRHGEKPLLQWSGGEVEAAVLSKSSSRLAKLSLEYQKWENVSMWESVREGKISVHRHSKDWTKLYAKNGPPPLLCFELLYCGILGPQACSSVLEPFIFSDFSGCSLDRLHPLRWVSYELGLREVMLPRTELPRIELTQHDSVHRSKQILTQEFWV